MNVTPYIPPDVQRHMDENGYELKCAKGFYWYVSGEENGEPFELGFDLFMRLYRAHNK